MENKSRKITFKINTMVKFLKNQQMAMVREFLQLPDGLRAIGTGLSGILSQNFHGPAGFSWAFFVPSGGTSKGSMGRPVSSDPVRAEQMTGCFREAAAP
jgi:hypothetical protein